MRKKRLLKVTAVMAIIFAMAFGLMACKDKETPKKSDTSSKTVTAMMSGDLKPESADTVDTSISAIKFYELVYDPLVRYGENGKIEPALAESYEISEDGTVYTFKLRKGVKFSNGEDFNADNVLFNTDRWNEKVRSNFSAKLLDVKTTTQFSLPLIRRHIQSSSSSHIRDRLECWLKQVSILTESSRNLSEQASGWLRITSPVPR